MQVIKSFLAFVAIIAFLACGVFCPCRALAADSNTVGSVRTPVVAGQFYPDSPAALSQMLEGFFAKAPILSLPGDLKALIVPHAGYPYSGQVAAAGFSLVKKPYQRVFVLAANHAENVPPFKFSVGDYSSFQTPLGSVRVSSVVKEILKDPLFSFTPEAYLSHIVEVELPFLQKRLTDFEIVPIVVGRTSREELSAAMRVVSRYVTEDSLVVVSSDLSHYHPYAEAVKLDESCTKAVEAQDMTGASRCEACGLPAILMLLELAKDKGWKSRLIERENSGDTAGPKESVVGYSSIAFYKEELPSADKQALLRLSRSVLESFVKTKAKPNVDSSVFTQAASEKHGCFVTLEKKGELRGCIGDLQPTMPLYDCVLQKTISAAVSDPRFPPVTAEELKDIKIEISVLTVPTLFQKTKPDQLLDALTPKKDGVILETKWGASTYLPQVWETLPDKKSFLTHLCQKGGAPGDCWTDPGTKVFLYEALVFGEGNDR